jgi:hypothetical protein
MSYTGRVRNARRSTVGGFLFVGMLAITVLWAAIDGGVSASWEFTVGHVARTVAHLIGIGGGLVIVYYADEVRWRTSGSALARSMGFVEAGTALFVLVFLGMEADHLFGVRVWYFADTMALAQLWYMIALTVVMLCYTAAYRTLVVEMGG